ncbi:MAG: tRNA (guanosine(46)-N7)-methyltransferase TrmB [Lachnospiraceae bacterium]|nr:tRNA (guanosine(46)-N7)-methyltransferase TrmB [Lachnospiraceae bacterium]
MRLRNITGSKEMIAENEYVIHEPESYRGVFVKEIFENDRPLWVEIGTGKGNFIEELARRKPEINFLGIEKYSTVLLKAIRKYAEDPAENLRFIRMDAEYIMDVFAENEIGRIFLNFSDPWPKDRHAKRRLPSANFLRRFQKLLLPGGRIEFKTDNRELFDFAVEEAKAEGWSFLYLTYDLHNDPEEMKTNILTEYEAKFSAIGNPIYKYIIENPKA